MDASVDVAMARVERRHVAVGRTPEEARKRVSERQINENSSCREQDVAEVLVPSHEWDGNEER